MATSRLQVYKCEVCGNLVEMLNGGAGTLVCCDKPMKLYEENAVDAATEKHVPVVEAIEGGYKVVVGSVAHPMTGEHYIEWIELLAAGKVLRQFLEPRRRARSHVPGRRERSHRSGLLQPTWTLEGIVRPHGTTRP